MSTVLQRNAPATQLGDASLAVPELTVQIPVAHLLKSCQSGPESRGCLRHHHWRLWRQKTADMQCAYAESHMCVTSYDL